MINFVIGMGLEFDYHLKHRVGKVEAVNTDRGSITLELVNDHDGRPYKTFKVVEMANVRVVDLPTVRTDAPTAMYSL